MKQSKLLTKLILLFGMLVIMSGNVFGQTLVPIVDLGTNSSGAAIGPIPGPLDITNFNSAADTQNPEGFNYFIDNGGGLDSPGETFTAPPSNVVLTAVSILMGGNNGGGGLGPQPLYLNIFSVSGTTATLVANYVCTNTFSFLVNDWLQWSGLTVPLTANGTYAYTLSRGPSGTGWCQVYLGSGNTYAGGQAVEIQAAGGAGAVTYGTVGNYDGNFDLGIEPLTAPVATPPVFSPASPVYGGTPVTISETAGGNPPLFYRWQTDDGLGGSLSDIPGGTSSNVVVTPNLAGTYAYDVIVTNNSGSITSTIAYLTVNPPSVPLLTQDILPGTNVFAFANGTVVYTASFPNGTLPITNQWQANTNGSFLNIAGNTNILTLSNLQASAVGDYMLTASNAVGSATSSVSVLNILADPSVPTPSEPYAYCVYTNHPVAYWRLNETNDTVLSSMQAYDYSGNNHNGTYGHGASDNLPGPQSPAFVGFEANNTAALTVNGQANSFISVPPVLNLNTNTVTITAWINPVGAIGTYSGLFMWRGAGGDGAGFGFGGNSLGGVAELGYTWNTNSSSTWGYNSGLYPPLGQWSFVALTITPTNTSIYLYFVGGGATNLLKSVQVTTNGPESFAGGTINIASDNYDGRDFNGYIDEVAVFEHSLSEAQIQDLYFKSLGASGAAPSIATQPTTVSGFTGQPSKFTVVGSGAPTPTYQWQSGTTSSGPWNNVINGGRISGAASSVLAYNPAQPADAALYYQVVLANNLGSVTSSVVNLNLTTVPNNGRWTVNFAVNNTDNGNPGIVYSGPGILGSGTFWNAYNAYDGSTGTGTFLDDGVTPSGVSLAMANQTGEWCYAPLQPILLLQPYASCGTVPVGQTNTTTATFGNVLNGTYNVALYGIDGGYVDRGVTYTVNASSQTIVNVQTATFAPGDNTALFTGVVVTNNELIVSLVAADSPAHTPNNEGEFNGGQLQLVQAVGNPPNISNAKASGGHFVITGTSPDVGESYHVLSTTNLALPMASWTPVATGIFAPVAPSFSNSIPTSPGDPQRFYRVVEP